LADFRPEPENDVWRALTAIDERSSIHDQRPDPRREFLLLREMGRTTREGMEAAKKARISLVDEWHGVRELLASFPEKIERLRMLMTWLPRDKERQAMLTDLNEIADKFREWFDELAPPIQKGAPRVADLDPARRFAGRVFAVLSQRGFKMAALLELVTESASKWEPAPIRETRLRQLRKGRKLRDLVTALVREGQT
jgi:hypothetical protein